MKYSIMLIICALFLALTNCKQLHADELDISFIAGLHVKHFNSSQYVDYRKKYTKYTTYHTGGTTTVVKEYDYYLSRDYNEGTNNNMLGVKFTYGQYAVTASKFDNSYNEDGHAIAFTYDFIDSPEWELSFGPAITFGYRPALVHRDESKSIHRQIMPCVVTNVGYQMLNAIKLNYSIINHNTGMMTLEVMY